MNLEQILAEIEAANYVYELNLDFEGYDMWVCHRTADVGHTFVGDSPVEVATKAYEWIRDGGAEI